MANSLKETMIVWNDQLIERMHARTQCSTDDIALVSDELACAVSSFPCTYLGLPLPIKKPTKICSVAFGG